MYFELLHSRLVDYLRGRVKSGDMTERGLALMAGVSQPHLHNVLKGVREMSAGTADTVLRNLRLSAFDLLREEELAGAGISGARPRYREVPVAAGPLGPAHAFPDLEVSAGRMKFPAAELEGVAHPVAVRLAADPEAPAIFRAGDVVLLDVQTPGDQTLEAGCYYAIEEGGCGMLRCHERGRRSTVAVVRAQAIWMSRYLQARPDGAPAV